jgi:hypothetical protein
MTSENIDQRGGRELFPFVIDRNLRFTRPTAAKALEYWRSVKGDRAMPSRADISPAALRSILPQIALVDVPAAGDPPTAYVVRLAGDAIVQVYGTLTGKPLDQILPPDILARWVACFDTVRTGAEPVGVTSRVSFQNKTWLQAEVFIAPLGQDDRVCMLFGTVDVWPIEEA